MSAAAVVRALAALALVASLRAAQATVPVYGVVAQADLPPTAATWFAASQPDTFRRLVVGAATLSVPDSALATLFSESPVYHAQLVAVVGRVGAGWRIDGYAVRRLDRVGAQGTVVLVDYANAADRPPLVAAVPGLRAYVLAADARSARFVALDDGFLFPAAADATAFRWRSPTMRMPAQAASGWITAGGARLAPADGGVIEDVTLYGGGWVQMRDGATGAYRYVHEADLTRADGAPIDLVQYNDAFLLGGAFAIDDPSHASGSYPRGGASIDVAFDPRDAVPLTAITPDVPAPAGHPELAGPSAAQVSAAAASEQPAPTQSDGVVVVDTTCQRGEVPVLASDGTAVSGEHVPLYADGGDQTTQRVVGDVLTKRDQADVAHPATADDHPVVTDDGRTVDRLAERDTSAGASGRDLPESLDDARGNDYTPSLAGGDAAVAVPDGTDDQGRPRTTGVSGGDLLAKRDAALDAEVRPVDAGADAQPRPTIIDAQGSVQGALVAGADENLYARIDDVNERMAPHLEATTWRRAQREHHGAMIYPIDLVDAWMVQRWGAQTGVTIPDILGDNVPGDGDNPVIPEPNGTPDRYSAIHYAGHPFYDVDDDGDLDRWMTTDPFDNGYKKLRLRWWVEVGVKKLGSFRRGPATNVAITGLKKPRRDDTGHWVIDEDLLLHIGHNIRPFKKRKWRFGWQTYYASGLITPLDPIDATDHARYQFAIRNVDASASDDAGDDDGADPEELIPDVETPSSTITVPLAAGGTELHTVQYRIEWYARLAGQLQPDDPPDPEGDWQWRWDSADAALPAGTADRADTPVVVRATEMAPDGHVVSSTIWRRPVLVDASGAHGFDPTLVPVAPATDTPSRPLADAYMWDYPAQRSSAEWLASGVDPRQAPQADVAHWRFPWNIAWNTDPHSRRHTQQAFRLDSADLSLWPDLARKQPKITHAGLLLDRGPGDLVVQWSLRENDADDPSAGDDAVARWRDGDPLYLGSGWTRGMPWYAPGRSPFHVFGWDPRTDLFDVSRAVGGARIQSGSRMYDITGGAVEYLFRGKRYLPRDLEQQYLLLCRMWNYYFTGREAPGSGQTCLPSLCIPQRWDNWDLSAPPLDHAEIHDRGTLGSDRGADDRIGEDGRGRRLDGALLDEMRQPQDQRERQATERRARLMKEQVFLFSASRGREWELAMARRMPATVRLICLEYDDKDDVRRILGHDGHDVVFPETRTYRTTDPLGVVTETTESNEVDVLRELSMQWFDVRAPTVFYANGEMSTSNQADQQGKFPLQDISNPKFPPWGGHGSTLKKDDGQGFDGFMKHLPEGLPMAYAAYAYALRSRPDVDQRQWRPDDDQTLYKDYAFEFRHPMLVLYHDAASCVYVHYGRNCDPDEVFGHWDDCRPPAPPAHVASGESLRRERFEAWQDDSRLATISDALHPGGHAAELAARAEAPVEPPAPGDEPQPPAAPPWPGERPQPPVGEMVGWDGVTITTWTDPTQRPDPDAGLPLDWCPWRDTALMALPLDQAYERWLATITPYDDTVVGWLRASYATPDASGPAAIDVWRADAADAATPLGAAPSGRSADCFGIVFADVAASGAALAGPLGASDARGEQVLALDAPTCGAFALAAGAYRLRLADTGDTAGVFSFTAAAATTSFAAIAHPMTRAYYDAVALAPTVARYADLQARRRAAAAAFDDALARWPQTLAAWNAGSDAYQRWLRDDATYPMRHAAWQAAVAAHDQWAIALAAWNATQAQANQYVADRSAWIALVRDAVAPAGVAWPGDPDASRDSDAAIAAIAPQLPIWEAYRWFIDPASGVPEALAAEPR